MNNGKQSVFRVEEDKREPINKQAAMVFKRAHWDEMAPVKPKIIPHPINLTPEQIKEREANIRRIEEKQAFWEACEKTRIQIQKESSRTRVKIATCRVHAKNLLRAIHKRKGLPPPSFEEIAKFQKTLPGYGKKC